MVLVEFTINVLLILLLHFIADFTFQTDAQARGKSSSNRALFEHVFLYILPFWFFFGRDFALVTAVTHFIIDYNTSRVNKRLWESGDVHMFFVGVGADQYLHQCQLILTYLYIHLR